MFHYLLCRNSGLSGGQNRILSQMNIDSIIGLLITLWPWENFKLSVPFIFICIILVLLWRIKDNINKHILHTVGSIINNTYNNWLYLLIFFLSRLRVPEAGFRYSKLSYKSKAHVTQTDISVASAVPTSAIRQIPKDVLLLLFIPLSPVSLLLITHTFPHFPLIVESNQ